MATSILGLHHVTATVDAAQDDLDFCVGLLGLRLVKKTVNFDNHHVYHFYYGDERGTPGTVWTTFPYQDRGVPSVGRVSARSSRPPSRCRPVRCMCGEPVSRRRALPPTTSKSDSVTRRSSAQMRRGSSSS